MTIRSKMTLGPFVHEVEWAPGETINTVLGGLLGFVVAPIARLGAADRIDQEEGTQQPFGGWGMPSKRGR